MPTPLTTPITDPDFALLEILTDPSYPRTWALFDGVTDSLAKWIEDMGDEPEAPTALEQMLRNGLSPLVPLRGGSTTPLHLAADTGKVSLVRALTAQLRRRGTPELVNQPTGDGTTALWQACNGGMSAEVVGALLDAGADPTVQRNGIGLLWLVCSWAADPDRLGILERLLATPARDGLNRPGDPAFGGGTALHGAILHDNVPAIRRLMDAGADRTLQRQGQDAEALLAQRAQDDPEMAALLHEWRVARERVELHQASGPAAPATGRSPRRL